MKLIICILLTVLIGGCSTIHPDALRREQFEKLSQKYSQFDLKMAWDNKVSDHDIIVAGVVRNVRWFQVESLEIWVSLIAPDGSVLAKDVDLIKPGPLKLGEMASFLIRLRAKPVPGSKLQFSYKYSAIENNEQSMTWMQSFEADL
jgi:hypothetical protein